VFFHGLVNFEILGYFASITCNHLGGKKTSNIHISVYFTMLYLFAFVITINA